MYGLRLACLLELLPNYVCSLFTLSGVLLSLGDIGGEEQLPIEGTPSS